MEFLENIFGTTGSELSPVQMSLRAASAFVIALVLIRISGRRSFGLHSPFDSCTTVLFGAILSRAVTGASPYLSTVAAATALVLMHRIVGRLGVIWPSFERLVSGSEITLMEDGRVDEQKLRQALVTPKDVAEAVRRKVGNENLARVARAVLERNGEITIVPIEPQKR